MKKFILLSIISMFVMGACAQQTDRFYGNIQVENNVQVGDSLVIPGDTDSLKMYRDAAEEYYGLYSLVEGFYLMSPGIYIIPGVLSGYLTGLYAENASLLFYSSYDGGQEVMLEADGSANPPTLKIRDNRTVTTGLEYVADYSADYTSRSLIDKGYADATYGGASYTFDNGLTESGGTVDLGDLTAYTDIDGFDNGLNWNMGSNSYAYFEDQYFEFVFHETGQPYTQFIMDGVYGDPTQLFYRGTLTSSPYTRIRQDSVEVRIEVFDGSSTLYPLKLKADTNIVETALKVDGPIITPLDEIADNDATPDVSEGNIFVYAGSANSVTITDLDNPTAGTIYTIVGNSDTYTVTIADSGNFNLSASWTGGADDTLVLLCLGDNDYIEISRTDN